MRFERTVAEATISHALNHHSMMNHREVAEALQKAARISPKAIRDKIAHLQSQIQLLEAYLPEGENEPGDAR